MKPSISSSLYISIPHTKQFSAPIFLDKGIRRKRKHLRQIRVLSAHAQTLGYDYYCIRGWHLFERKRAAIRGSSVGVIISSLYITRRAPLEAAEIELRRPRETTLNLFNMLQQHLDSQIIIISSRQLPRGSFPNNIHNTRAQKITSCCAGGAFQEEKKLFLYIICIEMSAAAHSPAALLSFARLELIARA